LDLCPSCKENKLESVTWIVILVNSCARNFYIVISCMCN
jgi:hypothetical protein